MLQLLEGFIVRQKTDLHSRDSKCQIPPCHVDLRCATKNILFVIHLQSLFLLLFHIVVLISFSLFPSHFISSILVYLSGSPPTSPPTSPPASLPAHLPLPLTPNFPPCLLPLIFLPQPLSLPLSVFSFSSSLYLCFSTP